MDLQEFFFNQTTSKSISSSRLLINLGKGVMDVSKKIKSKKDPTTSERVEVFQKILEWRKNNEAPVDTMGCQRLADPKASVDIQKFQTLVALMLSVQTKDQITSMIVGRLKSQGLTPENISTFSEEKLRSLIYESNFNKRKAANLIAVSKIILEQGRIANTKEQILKYPGVGIKIAMLYLKVAEGKTDQGIGVDTHVHRISNRLGWVKTKDPEETEKQLRQVFPISYWKDINICLVGFGQVRCQAKKPLCKGCPVSSKCPSALCDW